MKSHTGRHSLRLRYYDYSQLGAYFVTICAYKKETIFGQILKHDMELSEAGNIVVSIWDSLPSRYPSI